MATTFSMILEMILLVGYRPVIFQFVFRTDVSLEVIFGNTFLFFILFIYVCYQRHLKKKLLVTFCDNIKHGPMSNKLKS